MTLTPWLAALLLAAGLARAQSPELTVHLRDGSTLTLPTDRIRSLRFSGVTTVTEPGPDPGFVLQPAWPNPFNPSTRLEFELPEPARITVRILDLKGAVVATLAEGPRDAGVHRLEWDGRNREGLPVASGLYLASVSRGAQVRTTKLVLLK